MDGKKRQLAEAALSGLRARHTISDALESVKYDDPELWNEILDEVAENIQKHLDSQPTPLEVG